jgi:hypothetical protein
MSNAEKMRWGNKYVALIIRNGNKSNVKLTPKFQQLYNAEPIWTNDTKEMFINSGDGGDPDQELIKVGGKTSIMNVAFADSPYTVGEFDDVLLIDTTGGAVTITLSSDWIAKKKSVTIKDTGNAGTNNITVNTEGAETIDGSASDTLSTNYVAQKYLSNGTNVYKL